MPSHQSIGPDWFITSAQPTTQDQQYISEHKSVGANVIGLMLVFTHTSNQLKTHLLSEAYILEILCFIALVPTYSTRPREQLFKRWHCFVCNCSNHKWPGMMNQGAEYNSALNITLDPICHLLLLSILFAERDIKERVIEYTAVWHPEG